MKALAFVMILVLLGAVLLGASLSRYSFDGQLQQVELQRAREEATINLEALRARRARETELYSLAVTVLLVVVSVAILLLASALAYYLVCRGAATRGDSARRNLETVQWHHSTKR